MDFNEYQKAALTTAKHVDHGTLDLCHWALGLSGESGEIAEKVKKLIRDSNQELNDETKQLLVKELGDVLWYLAVFADHIGADFETVAKTNLDKLQSRKQRNVLGGSGDNR